MVSVCMITYNHEKFIQEAIEGVLMQQFDFEIELILANDCSTDKTDEVIQNILENHPHASWIKYTQHKKNLGMMPNFIWALQQCKGKYIALCEGDDYWTDSSKLQKQVDFLEGNQEYIVCYHDVNVIDEKGNQSSNSLLGQWKKDYSEVELKKGAWLPTLTRCFRNMNFIFPSEFYKVAAGDHFLTGILGLYGKAKYLDFNGGNYRIHKNGVWNSKNIFDSNIAMLKDYILLIKFWKNKNEKEVYNFYKSSIKNTNEKLIEICMKNNEIKYFIKVLRINFMKNKSFYSVHNIVLIVNNLTKKILKKMVLNNV